MITPPVDESYTTLLLLIAILVKELVTTVKWTIDRKKGDAPAQGWKANAEQHAAVRRELGVIQEKLGRILDDHSSHGHHHRAVELANRRIAALLRNSKVDDPG